MLPKHLLQSSSLSQATLSTDNTHKRDALVTSRTYMSPNANLTLRARRGKVSLTQAHVHKYFGKKALYVADHFDEVHAISFRKYFTRFQSISQNYELQPIKEEYYIHFECLGDRVMLRSWCKRVSKTMYKKMVLACKNLTIQDLALYNNIPWLKTLKFLPRLRQLNLTLSSESKSLLQSPKFLEYIKIMKSRLSTLTLLEEFTLKICKEGSQDENDDGILCKCGVDGYLQGHPDYNVQATSLLDTMKKMIKRKSLRIFNLDLGLDRVNYQFLAELLLCLQESQVKRWSIKVLMMVEDMEDLSSIQHVLAKVEFLGLEFNLWNRNGYESLLVPPVLMPELTAKRKKVLILQILDHRDNRPCNKHEVALSLSTILSHYKSLRGLYLKSASNILKWNIPRNTITRDQDSISLTTLRDLVFIIDDSQASVSGIIKPFSSVIACHKPPLQTLNLLYCYKERYQGVSDLHDYLSIPYREFNNIKTLKELTLHCSIVWPLGLKEELESLRNLRKFTLNLGASKEAKRWDEDFPFDSLAHLSEFCLIIDDNMKILPWGKALAENLPKLSHLKVLEITDYTYTAMPIHIISDVIKGLVHFKSLRKLTIETSIKKEVSKDMLVLEEAKLIEGIKSNVRVLIRENPLLRELSICYFEGFSIREIEYDKFKKISYK